MSCACGSGFGQKNRENRLSLKLRILYPQAKPSPGAVAVRRAHLRIDVGLHLGALPKRLRHVRRQHVVEHLPARGHRAAAGLKAANME